MRMNPLLALLAFITLAVACTTSADTAVDQTTPVSPSTTKGGTTPPAVVTDPSSVASSAPPTVPSPPTAAGLKASATIVGQAADAPPRTLPTEIDGFAPTTETESESIRVFVDGGMSLAQLGGAVGNCGAMYWTLRWRSVDRIPVVVGRAGGSAEQGTALSDLIEVAASGTSGYITGFACAVPAFGAISESGTSNQLTDVLVEYREFEPTVSGPLREVDYDQSSPPVEIMFAETDTTTSCDGYAITAAELPVTVCEESIGVGYIQQALDDAGYPVERDSKYGPGTVQAVRQFQLDHGLVPDGTVGRTTWAILMLNAGLPGIDEDGDGIIFPDELGE